MLENQQSIIHKLPAEIFAHIFDYLHNLFNNFTEWNSFDPEAAQLLHQVNNLSLISSALNELMEDYFNNIWSRVFEQLVNRKDDQNEAIVKISLCQSLLERGKLKSSICKLLEWKQKMMKELLKSREFSVILLSDKRIGRSDFHKKLEPYTSQESPIPAAFQSEEVRRQHWNRGTLTYNHFGFKTFFFDFLKCETKLITISDIAHEKENRYHCDHYRTGNAFILLIPSWPLKKDYDRIESWIECIQMIKDSSDFPLIIYVHTYGTELEEKLLFENLPFVKEKLLKIVKKYKLTNIEIITQLNESRVEETNQQELKSLQACFNRFIQGSLSNFEVLQNFIIEK